eukprot:427337_1
MAAERNCVSCQKPNASKLCGGCKQVHYCSKTCQVNHWKSNHKKECKRLKKQSEISSSNKFKNEAKQILSIFESLTQTKRDILSWVIFYEIRDRYFKAVQYNPNDTNTYVRLSSLYYYLSDQQIKYQEAKQCAIECIQINPLECEAWIMYGLCCMKLKKYNLASIAFHTAKEIDLNFYNSFKIQFDSDFKFDQKYVNTFDQRFFNRFNEQQTLMKNVLDTDAEIRNIFETKGPNSNAWANALSTHPICEEFTYAVRLYQYRKRLKYTNDRFIRSLNATDFVWNLKIVDDGGKDSEILDFPTINKKQLCVEITNSSK